MGQDSKIEWCDDTINFWWGCVAVSPACKNCYAESWARRYGVRWGPHGDRRLRVENALRDLRRLARLAEKEGRKRTVFMQSMSDTFEDRPSLDEPREAALRGLREMGRDCGLIPLLLTKRPDRMASWAERNGWPDWWAAGTTVEDQQRADERIPHLLRVPATVRFLSCEPLFEFVNMSAALYTQPPSGEPDESPEAGGMWRGPAALGDAGVRWVIAGGESGPKARPSHPLWFRSLRDQCLRTGVPFFFKQWGEWAPPEAFEDGGMVGPGWHEESREDGGLPRHYWPDAPIRETARRLGKPVTNARIDGDTVVYRAGKKATGALLDGREWKQTPWSAVSP